MRKFTDEEAIEAKKRQLSRQNSWRRADQKLNPKKWFEQRKKYRTDNHDYLRQSLKEETAKLREEVIAAYGGRCNCPGCHVEHSELLTIDHVKPHHHRKNGKPSTRGQYYWIRNHDYPSDFQILCGSCNLAKSDKAQCPLAGVEH